MKPQSIRVPVELVIDFRVGPNLASLTAEPIGMCWGKDARFPDVPAHNYSADSPALLIAYKALHEIAKYPNAVTRKAAEEAMAAVDAEQAKR